MPAAGGALGEAGGRPALRFERILAHPPERIWSALTEPGEQWSWHPTPATLDPRPGGAVSFQDKERKLEIPDGEVLEWDPPHLLAYTWGGEETDPDHLRWELRPHDDGCLLVLVHSFGDRLGAARFGAGWHLCLDALAADLDGGEPPPRPHPGVSAWDELHVAYLRRFGIEPGEESPPPRLN